MKILRLKNGEMILGDVTTKGSLTVVTEPLFVIVTDGGYQFVNILKPISNDTKIEFESSEVLFSITPNEKLISYHQTTFSSIKTPKPKKLIV